MFEKTCYKCKKIYQSETFASKFCSQCKVIPKQYYQQHKEQRKAYQKERRIKNLEKVKSQEKLYQERIKKLKQRSIEKRKKNRYLITQGQMVNLGQIVRKKPDITRQCSMQELERLKQQKKHFTVTKVEF